jgi:hypothetical protein
MTCHYRMTACFSDGGVSSRSMGGDRGHAEDVFNVTVFGYGHDEIMYCALLEIDTKVSPINRKVIHEIAPRLLIGQDLDDYRSAVAEMAGILARKAEKIAA